MTTSRPCSRKSRHAPRRATGPMRSTYQNSDAPVVALLKSDVACMPFGSMTNSTCERLHSGTTAQPSRSLRTALMPEPGDRAALRVTAAHRVALPAVEDELTWLVTHDAHADRERRSMPAARVARAVSPRHHLAGGEAALGRHVTLTRVTRARRAAPWSRFPSSTYP